MEKLKQLNVRIPEDTHRKLKVIAALKGRSMAELVMECIREMLEKQDVKKGSVL